MSTVTLRCNHCKVSSAAFATDEMAGVAVWLKSHEHAPPETFAEVTLFKASGKYYTTEKWRVPAGTIGPYDMEDSPDFRRISGGAVLVGTQEPWGYPHLFPGVES
jgi:hypothetical protein